MNEDVNYNKVIKGKAVASGSLLQKLRDALLSIFSDNQSLRDSLMLTKQWRLKEKKQTAILLIKVRNKVVTRPEIQNLCQIKQHILTLNNPG